MVNIFKIRSETGRMISRFIIFLLCTVFVYFGAGSTPINILASGFGPLGIESSENDPDYEPNFESIEDSLKDLINYSSFAVAYARGKIDGQDPNRDFLNRDKNANRTDG